MEINFENVRDIIVNTLSCEADQITPETNLYEDLEADSLEAVELSGRYPTTAQKSGA